MVIKNKMTGASFPYTISIHFPAYIDNNEIEKILDIDNLFGKCLIEIK